MDRKGGTVVRGLARFLPVAICASLAVGSSVQAIGPATAAPDQLAGGTWTVRGTRVPGSRRCGEWLVRLTNARGQLSGVVSHARATVPIQNLVLMPDGSFSGTTQARMVGSRRAPPSTVTGQFSGNTVSLTFNSERCPPRHGTAIREAERG
jgi:hypothetical protein